MQTILSGPRQLCWGLSLTILFLSFFTGGVAISVNGFSGFRVIVF